MKDAPKKEPKVKEVKFPKANLKTGELGFVIATKKKGEELKYYTVKGKIKHAAYFLHSMVKTAAVLFDLDNIDLVQYVEEEVESVGDKAKAVKERRENDEQKMEALKEIQKVIDEKKNEGENQIIKNLEDAK